MTDELLTLLFVYCLVSCSGIGGACWEGHPVGHACSSVSVLALSKH